MSTRRHVLGLAGGAVLSGAWLAQAEAAPARIVTGAAFGSAWRLVLPAAADAQTARRRVEEVVARIDDLMSPFRAGAELARFNVTGSARLAPETAMVTRAALELARASGGAFDPTAAPMARRFGFGAPAIAASRPAGRHADLRLSGTALETACPGLSLDLCGIAKGHALDEIVRALDGLDFLIELGGEVAARGRHPSGRPWRVGIERPGTDALQRVVQADARALATSGDAAQSYLVGARRYAHIVDPRTGAPVDNGVASVSVRAATGLLADGLATAAMVLGPQAARTLLRAHDASALFLMRASAGLREIDLNGFEGGAA